MIPFKAAVFDMDGTILDSMDVWERIDYDFLEKRRNIKVPEDYVQKIAPMSFKEISYYTKNRFNLPESEEEIRQEWTDMAIDEYTHNIRLKDGAREYIELLKRQGKKIILCTSSPEIFYKPALISNGIYDMFDGFSTTCEAGVGKNKPDVYLLAAKKAGVSPCECLVFEDILSAAQCAKNINMKICGVYDNRSKALERELKSISDIYIYSFRELLEEEK